MQKSSFQGYVLTPPGPGRLNKMISLLKMSSERRVIRLKPKQCVKKQLRNTHGHWCMSQIILKIQMTCNKAVDVEPCSLKSFPHRDKIKEIFEKAIEKGLLNLRYVPNDPKFLEVCEKAVEDGSWHLEYVPDHFKTQEVCEKAVKNGPWYLEHVLDHFKTRGMCEKAVEK